MDIQTVVDAFRQREQSTRERGNVVIRNAAKTTSSVGKHEARNYAHLLSVLEEADAACPRAADTIRWLIWHEILDAQWAMQMVELIDSGEKNGL